SRAYASCSSFSSCLCSLTVLTPPPSRCLRPVGKPCHADAGNLTFHLLSFDPCRSGWQCQERYTIASAGCFAFAIPATGSSKAPLHWPVVHFDAPPGTDS